MSSEKARAFRRCDPCSHGDYPMPPSTIYPAAYPASSASATRLTICHNERNPPSQKSHTLLILGQQTVGKVNPISIGLVVWCASVRSSWPLEGRPCPAKCP